MDQEPTQEEAAAAGLAEVRYSLRDLIEEVQAEREGSSIGQEIVDQTEISKLFDKRKKGRRGNKGK